MTQIPCLDTEIAVIGGGPAGLACAWETTHAGLDTVLVERKAEPDHVMEGIVGVLHDSNMAYPFDKERLNLGSDLELDLSGHITKTITRLVLVGGGGETCFETPEPVQYYTDFRRILRRYLDALADTPAARLLYPWRANPPEVDTGGRIESVPIRGPEGLMHLRARHYVFADGVNSPSLQTLNLRRRPLGRGYIISQSLPLLNSRGMDADSLRFYAGPPFLENHHSLGLLAPFSDYVHASVLSYVPEAGTTGALAREYPDFLSRFREQLAPSPKTKPAGCMVRFHAPLREARVAPNAHAVGDAAWAVEMYYLGAMYSGSRLGRALTTGDRDVIDYEDWFRQHREAHGTTELKLLLWLARMSGHPDSALTRILGTTAGLHLGPYRHASGLRTMARLLPRLLRSPDALWQAWTQYRTMNKEMAPWTDWWN